MEPRNHSDDHPAAIRPKPGGRRVPAPLREFGALLSGLAAPRGKGAPAAWTLWMTLAVILLPLVLVVLHRWDAPIVRGAMTSDLWLMEVARLVTSAVKAVYWLALSVVVWVLTCFVLRGADGAPWRRRIARLHDFATFLILSILVAGIPVEIGKRTAGRARPALMDEYGSLHLEPFHGGHAFESFPSGHSMMTGILLVALWIFLPRWRGLVLPAALLMLLGRLAAGMHYPTDVVAGFAIGIVAAAWIARFMAGRGVIFRPVSGRGLPSLAARPPRGAGGA
ncbi:phosphatase PAP2 family protein [Pontibaca methylaminivorans]|uniref:PAP2 superfamily protein n=1 Tax=Pontibaca methylaminivorans TaxID=515897 RepID=A0A1R3WZF8_9RHOB|nr:phosphatase PAP2 family protein [Pontibaca methylaminivorans]SIT83723.1 PAP2 superfamily protein [Pontibaca methylaminivorans]